MKKKIYNLPHITVPPDTPSIKEKGEELLCSVVSLSSLSANIKN